MPAHSQKVKAAPVGTRVVMPVFPRLRVPVWLAALALVLGTVLAYQPAWHAGFIWDDDVYVTQNALLTAPDGLWRIWFSLDSPSQYFPLTYTVFRFEHLFWGQAAAGYHCLNILLHALNALLVWRLWHRLGAWSVAGGGDFRPAPRAGRIRRLGDRTQKCVVVVFYPVGLAGLAGVHPRGSQARLGLLFGRAVLPSLGPGRQVHRLYAPGGLVSDAVAQTPTHPPGPAWRNCCRSWP